MFATSDEEDPRIEGCNWVFTWNNYPENADEILAAIPHKYLVYGREIAPETGTPHLQGFIQVPSRKRFSALKKLFPGCWLRRARAKPEQAAEYAKKDGNYVELGQMVRPGQKEGHVRSARTVEERMEKNKRLRDTSLWELVDNGDISICQVRGLKNARLDLKEEQNRKAPMQHLGHQEVVHEWYWGPSGTGKSRKARTENPDAYLKTCNKWWDGYDNEDVVLIEDFDKAHSPLCHHLKIWGDIYTFPAEVKGGNLGKIRPKKIVITSNYSPADIWENAQDREPIERRFNIKYFSRDVDIDLF